SAGASQVTRPLAGFRHLKGAVIKTDNDTSDPPMHALGMIGNGYVVIPKCFVSFLSFTVSDAIQGSAIQSKQVTPHSFSTRLS
ncbi:MAG: hypothetical protein ACK5ES_07145, partial [Planctomyces sp.]